MYIKDVKTIKQAIRELEKSMEIQEGFFYNLLRSDSDWSFIIKLHTFLEVICTVLIIKELGREELTDVISRLEMSENIYGKTVFISKLSLLNKGAISYIRKISEIRNFYVHNVKNISLTLKNYLKKLDKNQIKSFVNSIGYDTYDEIKIEKVTITKKDFILRNPRLAIHMAAFSVLAETIPQIRHEKLKFKEIRFKKKAAEFLLSLLEKKEKTEIRQL